MKNSACPPSCCISTPPSSAPRPEPTPPYRLLKRPCERSCVVQAAAAPAAAAPACVQVFWWVQQHKRSLLDGHRQHSTTTACSHLCCILLAAGAAAAVLYMPVAQQLHCRLTCMDALRCGGARRLQCTMPAPHEDAKVQPAAQQAEDRQCATEYAQSACRWHRVAAPFSLLHFFARCAAEV
jgi:hypothetical protein